MKKHIKEAWLARLTPEWWVTRARGRMRDKGGRMCVAGVLCDVIDPSRWEPLADRMAYRFPNGQLDWAGLPPEVQERIGVVGLAARGGAMYQNDNDRSAYDVLPRLFNWLARRLP